MAFTEDANNSTVFTSQNSNMLSKERNLRNKKSETASHLLMDSIYFFFFLHTSQLSDFIGYTNSVYVSMLLPAYQWMAKFEVP